MSTLGNLLSVIDKRECNSDWVDVNEIAEHVGVNIDEVDLSFHHFSSFWLARWIDIDTHCGTRVIFLHQHPKAIITQSSRKSTPVLKWINSDAKIAVRTYLLSLVDKNTHVPDITDSEFGNGFRLEYAQQTLREMKCSLDGEQAEIAYVAQDLLPTTVKIKYTNSGTETEVDIRSLIFHYHSRY